VRPLAHARIGSELVAGLPALDGARDAAHGLLRRDALGPRAEQRARLVAHDELERVRAVVEGRDEAGRVEEGDEGEEGRDEGRDECREERGERRGVEREEGD